jgi:hypothetical protein
MMNQVLCLRSVAASAGIPSGMAASQFDPATAMAAGGCGICGI